VDAAADVQRHAGGAAGDLAPNAPLTGAKDRNPILTTLQKSYIKIRKPEEFDAAVWPSPA
jgi:hypothetical protein